MAFLVSLQVDAPDTVKSELRGAIMKELATLGDVAVIADNNSEYQITVHAIEADSDFHLSVLVTRTVWKDVEFWVRRALLDIWDVISEKVQVALTERGAVINDVVRQLGTDHSIKAPRAHWPMVVAADDLTEASTKIVSYFDTKFLETARQRLRPAIPVHQEEAAEAQPAKTQPVAEAPPRTSTQAGQEFRHIIKARDIIADIRSSMSEAELIAKYKVTKKGLQNAFRQLVLAGAVTAGELTDVYKLPYTSAAPENQRQAPRYYLDFELLIHEQAHPDVQGVVRDLAEEGVGIVGIEAEVDQTKTLVILGDEFGAVDPFHFEAQCRWVKRQSPDGEIISGFQITNITEEHRRALHQLIRIVTVED